MGPALPSSIRNSEMKSFVLKLSLFVFIVIFLCVMIVGVMYYAEKEAYLHAVKLGPDCEVVVFGDSRAAQNVDPEMVPGCVNLSRGGLNVYFWEQRLGDFIAANDGDGCCRRILIEIRPSLLNGWGRPKIADYQREWAFWWLMHPELFDTVVFDNFPLSFMAAEFPVRFIQYVLTKAQGKVFHSAFAGGHEIPGEKSGFTEAEFGEMAARVRESLGRCEYDFTPFDRLIRKARGNGWKPVFVTYPVFAIETNPEAAARFRERVSAFASSNNVSWIDLSGECQKMSYWLDGGHLKRKGAEIIGVKWQMNWTEPRPAFWSAVGARECLRC